MKALVAFALSAVGCLAFFPLSAAAQAPRASEPLKLVVPFAPGGGVDIAARLLARQLQVQLGAPVIVENKAGGSGVIGGKAVLSAPADGQTLLFSAATHVLAKQVLANAPYDPQLDFMPVARVGEAPLLIVLAPTLPQTKMTEVFEAIAKQPEKWTAALPALGAPSHIGTLLFAKQGNIKLNTVTYKGTAPALTDVAGGHTQLLIDSIISLQAMVRSGKVRGLATLSKARSSVAPEIPTAAESGYPELIHASWYGVWAPKGTPVSRVQALNQAINAAVGELAKSGEFAKAGIEPITETADQFRNFVNTEVAKSVELLNASGYKPE